MMDGESESERTDSTSGDALTVPAWKPPERWTREPSIATDMRGAARVALVLYGVSLALAALTFAFPNCLLPQENTALFCLPPQTYAGLATTFLTICVVVIMALLAVVASVRYKRWGWLPIFVVVLSVALLGPALLVEWEHNRYSMPLNDDQLRASLIVSSVALLLVPLLAIVFANRLRESRPAAPG